MLVLGFYRYFFSCSTNAVNLENELIIAIWNIIGRISLMRNSEKA